VKQRWNWVLGGISLACAVWGILAFFHGEGVLKDATLGGKIGQSIIMYSPDKVGGLLVAGLVLLGIILIIPRKCWNAAKNVWRLLTKVFRPRLRGIFSRRAPAKATSLEATSPEAGAVNEEEAKPAPSPSPPVWQSEHEPILTPGGWHLPPIDILDKPVEMKLDKDAIDQRARLIEEALASYGVEAKVVQINIGPTVTQFGVEPGWDRKYKEIRERLLKSNNVFAIISLPKGVFKQVGADVKTYLIFFDKSHSTKNIWYYEVEGNFTRTKMITDVCNRKVPENSIMIAIGKNCVATLLFHRFLNVWFMVFNGCS